MNAMQLPICIKLEDNFWDRLMWDKDLSDIEIKVKDKEGQVQWVFSLHTIILSRRSLVFKDLIKRGETIVMEDVSIAILNKFLKYLYLGDIFVETWKEIISLVDLSKKYEVVTLTTALETNLPKFVNFVNVCLIMNEAARLGLQKVEDDCLALMVRSGQVIFGTAGFLELSQDSLYRFLSDDRLNVPREVDALLALICWARNDALVRGEKLGDQALYEKVSPKLLQAIRLTLIKDEERDLVPEPLAKLIFAKKEEKGDGDKDGEKKGDEKPAEDKPRTPSKETCLLGHFSNLVMRKPELAVGWISVGKANTLALKFSVTMPIFLGGFLAHYRCDGGVTMYVNVQDIKKNTEVKIPFRAKKCDHTLLNEEPSFSNHRSTCFEPNTPLLVLPGQQLNVFFQMDGPYANETSFTTFPNLVLKTGEGPDVQLYIDKVHTIRRMYFMSACGMCSVSPLSL